MTDRKQGGLAPAFAELREPRERKLHRHYVEPDPFFGMGADERAAVLALDHVPRELHEIQALLREALPGREIFINDYWVGGRGNGNYCLRIGDHSLHLEEQPGFRFTIALPAGL